MSDSYYWDVVGSGGGYSQAELRPGYQAKLRGIGQFTAVPYLTPADFTTVPGSPLVEPMSWNVWDAVSGSAAAPATTTGLGTGRAVPDISADADPYTGYEEYFSGFPGNHLELGWTFTTPVPAVRSTTRRPGSARRIWPSSLRTSASTAGSGTGRP